MENTKSEKGVCPNFRFLLLGLGILLGLGFLVFGFQHNISAKASQPKRIVSLAPSITETLFALGLDDEVVGVTNFCDYPAKALTKTRVGGFINPNIETIISLKPDLVISTAAANSAVLEIKKLGINTIIIKTDSFEDILGSINQIGAITNRSQKAKYIVSQIQYEVKKITDKLSSAKSVKVLIAIDHNPIFAMGKGTFGDSIIKICKGENISVSPIKYPKLDLEYIISQQPEVIIETGTSDYKANDILIFWQKWREIPAVKNNRIYFIDSSILSVPGPRIVKGIKKLAECIHPEIFDGGVK